MTQQKFLQYALVGLGILSFVLVFPYAKPEKYVDRGDQFYLTNEATTTSSSELMPLWVKEKPTEHYKNKVEVVTGNASITNLESKSNRLSFKYKADGPVVLRVNTVFYPGWRAYLNNDEVKIRYENPKGVMEIEANQYRDSVLFVFQETLLRVIADTLSIASFLVILFILLRPLLLFKS